MYVAGRANWKISLDEPQVLRVALYLRDVCRLEPDTDPVVPPLDPPATAWPVWTRRPPEPRRHSLTPVQSAAAAAQWARWWNYAVDAGGPAWQDLAAPHFRAFSHLPELRSLLVRHHRNAVAWATASADDPRVKRDHLVPGSKLTALVADLERQIGRPARRFDLRVTVVPVEGKKAWQLGPQHLLITHHLLHDDEIVLDWLRSLLVRLV